jgi:hypothetical protein
MTLASNTQSTLGYGSEVAPSGYSPYVNRTSVSLSTNILIYVGATPVGAVQTISVDENRAIRFFSEVGTDGHVDSAPQSSTTVNGSCTRIRFDRLRVAEAFGRGFVHARSQVYPFDIAIIDRQRSDADNQIVTVIKNVWIKSINTTYSASDWIISDTMSYEAESIFSVIGGKDPVARGGLRNIPVSIIGAERDTDIGLNGRRGSMDVSGIVDIGSSGNIF